MTTYRALLSTYTPAQTEYEEALDRHHRLHVVVRAVFDHDWEYHLLVQQCTSGPAARLLGMKQWEYALYFCGAGEVIHICTFFDATRCPFVEAASMVEEWEASGCGHYGGRSNSVESDIFD